MWSNPRVPFRLAGVSAPLAPLHGKGLMVHFVMNIEYWPFDRPMPRGIIPAPHGASSPPPDIPNFSWVEYGLRCGLPRCMRILGERGVRASAFLNAQVADVYPSIIDAVLAADWEMVGHGWFQQSLKQADDEETVIQRSLDRLEAASGRRPRAWLGPGLGETECTPDILKACGIEFLHDWALDDKPVWMRTAHGPLVGLPYTFELNDVPIYAVQNQSSDDFFKRLQATVEIYSRERAEDDTRIITLALHPHIIGVPHVAAHLERAIDFLLAREDTVFVTSSEMGDWFVAADGTGGRDLPPMGAESTP